MQPVLVGGTALAGLLAGPIIDRLAAAIPPAAKKDEDPPAPPAPPGRFEMAVSALVTAGVLAGLAIRFGPDPLLAPMDVLALGLVAVSISDFRVGLVPKKFLYPTLGLVVAGLVPAGLLVHHPRFLVDAAIGGAAAFVVFFAVWWIAPRSMGFGDVRLAGLIGIALGFLGFATEYLSFVIAFIAGAFFGIGKALVQRSGRKTSLPFGPSLAFGAIVGMLWGTHIATAWLHR